MFLFPFLSSVHARRIKQRSRTLTLAQVFLNIVLDEAVEERPGGERVRIGMCVIRGNSVVMLEALERMGDDRR